MAVRRLASERQLAFEIAVEGNAEAQQVFDAVARLACDGKHDRFIDNARARRHRVGGMRFRRVARIDRRRDAALRPGARRAVADGRGGKHRDGAGRELQRREKTGKSRADDQDVAGIRFVLFGEDDMLRSFQ